MPSRSVYFIFVAIFIVCLLFFSAPLALAEKNSTKWGGGGFAKYVTIPEATRVGSETCANCHAEFDQNYRHAYHAQRGVDCEDCHGAGNLHADSNGNAAKIISFKRLPARDANGACLSCHAQDERIRNSLTSAHSSNGVRCTDCHQIHGVEKGGKSPERMNFDAATPGRAKPAEDLVPESKTMLQPRWQKNDACLKCHQAQRGEMSLPYHHPLREGKVTCVDCHDPHGGAGRNNLRTASVNQLCLGCHTQYRGPFAYQHPPVMENCMTCHTPHGSPNTNLLSVSEPALCLQCHAGHHNGANLPLVDRCTNCHASIHGSDIASATGGSVFIDKQALAQGGSVGAHARAGSRASRAAAPVAAATHAAPLSSSAGAGALGAPLGAALGGPLTSQLPALLPVTTPDPTGQEPGGETPKTYTQFSFTPVPYRFMHSTGYAGRVGEYDSLQQSTGGDLEMAYVSTPRRMTLLARTDLITGDDYRVAAQFSLGDLLEASFDTRSFLQQQDNYPFYGTQISPDILPTNNIPDGSAFAVTRRMGQASARIKVPNLPMHLFVKGNWQARAGTSQLSWYDMGGDSSCNSCHFVSQFQAVNYTTRNVGGGAELKLGSVVLTLEHDFSSFNNRLPFPSGLFGSTLSIPDDQLPAGVADTIAGTYFIAPPSPSQASTDLVRFGWTPSGAFAFNGDAGYTRLRNLFTRNPQNAFNANAAASWLPLDRLRITLDSHVDNVLNDFTPFFALYGNMSYHQHSEGLRMEYDFNKQFDLETRYGRSGITRSNSSLWPQFYSPDNTDLLYVVPSSFSNTAGLALRYHSGKYFSSRAGYEWTGTHAPGYLTVPGDNNRMFADVTITPVRWLSFTNDANILVQNAFPVIQRRNRFYSNTALASLAPIPDWNLELGYSYQQNNLATYMALQNDPGAGYILDAPIVPYKQLSQTYWVQSASRFLQQRLGFNMRFTYNSARSGMQPDVNPAHYPVMQDPVTFQQALDTFALASAQISQVIVPEYIGQAKLSYALPGNFDWGLLFYYGSYRDYFNPNLNGVLRTYSMFVGRSW